MTAYTTENAANAMLVVIRIRRCPARSTNAPVNGAENDEE
jgi:hypothetical protein